MRWRWMLHTSLRVERSLVEGLDQSPLLFAGGRVHFEVTSNKELARHDGRCMRRGGRGRGEGKEGK